MALLARDVAFLVYSRGREDCLSRLLADLVGGLVPVLREAGLSSAIVVYGQGYGEDFLDELQRRYAEAIGERDLALVATPASHRTIGEVTVAAVRALQERYDYRLAMLADDDSTFARDDRVDANLRQAASGFIHHGHRAYSIKLGEGRVLDYRPFLDPVTPIMPFREKMLWVGRPVLDEVLALPRFRELSIGEDAAIAAIAWREDPHRCFGVGGIGTFLHLGYERTAELSVRGAAGGYAELVRNTLPEIPEAPGSKWEPPLRLGVTPHDLMPDLFVGRDHPLFAYNGVRREAAAALGQR